MKRLRDVLPFISYCVSLQLITTPREYKNYSYMFPDSIFIDRGIIEKYYPELLERELSDGIHGEGLRDGLYIPIFED